ncbi:MAG: hypothetical protein FWG64_00495 [Firmicutes bacterium]|nr:hypothetical protein [Bacillota bacterium]
MNKKIYWHNAFYACYKLEFDEFLPFLEFIDEYQLSEEALIMDVLLIKKDPTVTINKNIGKIFRMHNITEYKSPSDSLTISDYHKIMGYAFLYATFNNVPLAEITITFVINRYPRLLIKYLQTERQLNVTEQESGIYYVNGDVFPMQILESKKLSQDSNIFLNTLRGGLNAKELALVSEKGNKINKFESRNPFYDRIIAANKKIFKEVMEMGKGWREEFFYDIYVHSEEFKKHLAKHEEEHSVSIAKRMLSLGNSIENIALSTDLPIETVENLRNAM